MTPWSECSATCGGGIRTRSIDVYPDGQGAPCLNTEEACNVLTCPIDCVTSDWSACISDDNCGPGVQTRTILTSNSFGGSACPDLTRPCANKPCPVPCRVSEWSECSKTCGGGVRTRDIIKDTSNDNNNRLPCPIVEETCNTYACPEDCVMSPWSDCSATCGGGIQTRKVLTYDSNGGIPCPIEKSRSCNVEECAQDCLISTTWSNEGPCSTDCGPGSQKQIKKVIIEESGAFVARGRFGVIISSFGLI